MKNIMILSGGTSTAWHIADVIKCYYSDIALLTICDINPQYLVHTSVLADKYIQVPLIKSTNYYQEMLNIMSDNSVDLLVPLIDDDINIFAKDNEDLINIGVKSVAPLSNTIKSLSNKKNMFDTLSSIGILTPKIYTSEDVFDENNEFFVKDALGCGSKGAELLKGTVAKNFIASDSKIVQDVCKEPEITVDAVLSGDKVYTICRERKEIKLGVSTKCKVFKDEKIQSIMQKISTNISLPTVFCVQFMKNKDNDWTLTDFNLRSGGGTAISSAVGFEAVRFAVAEWLGVEKKEEWLKVPETERYVVRRYQEVVTL